VAPDAEDIDQLGHSVSMSADGTRVLIGCSGDYVGGLRTGSAPRRWLARRSWRG